MATSVKLYPRQSGSTSIISQSLPELIQTPSGLALLELQGTINLPQADVDSEGQSPEIPVGRILFPDYTPNALDPSNTSWMKRVQLYIGQHQRMTGEVKKLPKPLAIIRKRSVDGDDLVTTGTSGGGNTDDLEVVEIVKYKIIFSSRPEPVGTT